MTFAPKLDCADHSLRVGVVGSLIRIAEISADAD